MTVDPASYPPVRRDTSVVDTLFDTQIPDPYRWLEDPDSPETAEFVAQQNKLTDEILSQCSTRDQFKSLFEDLYNYERYGLPFRKGDRYYYSHNSGLQAQNVIYTLDSLEDPNPKVFIDPNTLSEDGTVALMQYSFSEDGNRVAMAFSSGGSDWRTVKVSEIDQETGERKELASDELHNVKFTSLAWTHDNLGFFYCSYTAPDTTDAGTEVTKNENQQLRYHVIGRPQEEDATVLALPEEPEWMMGAEISHCGRYLILTISSGCEPSNRLWIVNLDSDIPRATTSTTSTEQALDFSSMDFHTGSNPLPIHKLVDDFKASWDYIATTEEGDWVLHTNHNAPRYKVVKIKNPCAVTNSNDSGNDSITITANGDETWKEIVPEHPKDVLQWASRLKGDVMVTCFLSDVKSVLQLRTLSNGSVVRNLELPGIGSVAGFSGSRKYDEFFFQFVGFTQPGAQYRCTANAPDAPPTLFRRIETKFDPDVFETKQVFVPSSKDGTKVPMFIIHRKGLALTGTAPTLLYGYGGFNISLEPSFSVSRMCWLLAYDGVMAVANLRGGGEYGRAWRDAGSLHNKQNVFDDFHSCAEFLQEQQYCSPSTLAIQGGSNGGLLVAACVNQRPDLYAVGLAAVGVLDMLRFSLFTIGAAWCTDYGDPQKKEEDFKYILKYSPLHNVAVPGGGTRQYPAVLLTTGDHDDRVVPLHTFKMLAQLQYVLGGGGGGDGETVSAQKNPLLARIEVRAGHGAGKPTSKVIAETSDMFSFTAACMGATWALGK